MRNGQSFFPSFLSFPRSSVGMQKCGYVPTEDRGNETTKKTAYAIEPGTYVGIGEEARSHVLWAWLSTNMS